MDVQAAYFLIKFNNYNIHAKHRHMFYQKFQKKLEFIQREREGDKLSLFFQTIFLVTVQIHQYPSFIIKVKDASSRVMYSKLRVYLSKNTKWCTLSESQLKLHAQRQSLTTMQCTHHSIVLHNLHSPVRHDPDLSS